MENTKDIQPLGFVTPVEIKKNNLSWPDPKGDNRELANYIYWKYKLKPGMYQIEYTNDETDLLIYPLDTVGNDNIQ